MQLMAQLTLALLKHLATRITVIQWTAPGRRA